MQIILIIHFTEFNILKIFSFQAIININTNEIFFLSFKNHYDFTFIANFNLE